MKSLSLCLLLVLIGCGNSSKTTTNPPPPPPPPVPTPMSAAWVGSLNFTTITGNLTLTISEDAGGNLSGTAVSTPPFCQFNSPITGKYFSSGQQFQVVSQDGIEGFTGTLSSDQKSLSGTVQIGQGGGCGPRTGSFAATKQ